MPVIWSTRETQDTSNAYKFDTYIRGSNLENIRDANKLICYYFFYSLDNLNEPFKIDYARVPSEILSDSKSHISC